MNYILFDESIVRTNLLPLTFMRPVADIRFGILTIREKWEKHLKVKTSTLTESYLSRKFPILKEDNNILINGSVCPNAEIVKIIRNLKPNQTEIYYLVGDSIERLKSNPKLESATARGIEVLLLTDPVDAFWTSAPLDFDGKPLKSLSQGDVDFGLIPLLDGNAADKEKPAADEAATIAVIKDVLGERVSDVRASQRLTTSASCLVAGGASRDRALERLLAQQNKGALTKPILEINMRHPLVAAIAGQKDVARDLSLLLLEQAQILDGELPEDPAGFASRLNELVLRGLMKEDG